MRCPVDGHGVGPQRLDAAVPPPSWTGVRGLTRHPRLGSRAIYTTFEVIHVIAATAWVGGAVFHLFASMRLVGSPPAVMDRWARFGDEAGRRFYSPAAMVTLLAGVGMVLVGNLSWGEPLVSVGFLGVILSLGIAFGRIRPTALAMIAELDAERPDPVRLAELGGRIRLASTANALVLLVVVAVMVVRPGG